MGKLHRKFNKHVCSAHWRLSVSPTLSNAAPLTSNCPVYFEKQLSWSSFWKLMDVHFGNPVVGFPSSSKSFSLSCFPSYPWHSGPGPSPLESNDCGAMALACLPPAQAHTIPTPSLVLDPVAESEALLVCWHCTSGSTWVLLPQPKPDVHVGHENQASNCHCLGIQKGLSYGCTHGKLEQKGIKRLSFLTFALLS